MSSLIAKLHFNHIFFFAEHYYMMQFFFISWDEKFIASQRVGNIFWKMVFCYQNCSDLLWEKIVPVIEKTFEIREFAKILRSLEQFIQTVKGQNNFW